MPKHADIIVECGTCRHADFHRNQDGSANLNLKVCKRFPLAVLLVPSPQGAPVIQTFQPIVNASNHCGEWGERSGVMPIPGDTKPESVKLD